MILSKLPPFLLNMVNGVKTLWGKVKKSFGNVSTLNVEKCSNPTSLTSSTKPQTGQGYARNVEKNWRRKKEG